MDTDALRWFQWVADGMTVTEVSDLEMMSQPAVSRALSRLEHEAGARLLERQGRRLVLTHAGAAFKRHVDSVLHHLDDGLAAVQQVVEPDTGTVTLSYQPSLGEWLIPDLVGSFRAIYPDVQFDLRSKQDEAELDIGPRSPVDAEISALMTPGSGYHRHTLATEPLRLLVPPHHRLAGEAEVALSDVREEPFVMMRTSSSLRALVNRLCNDAGFEPTVAFVVADVPSVRGYVAADLGIAVTPTLWTTSAGTTPRGIRYLRLSDPGAHRNIGFSWCNDRRALPAAVLFREHVLARAKAGGLPVPLDPGNEPRSKK